MLETFFIGLVATSDGREIGGGNEVARRIGTRCSLVNLGLKICAKNLS